MRWAPECASLAWQPQARRAGGHRAEGGSDIRSIQTRAQEATPTGSSTARRCSSATAGSPTSTSSWRPSTPRRDTAAGRVHRAQGHAGADHAASSTSSAAAPRTPARSSSRLPRARRAPTRRRGASGRADRQGPRGGARFASAGVDRRRGRPRDRGAAAQLGGVGAFERTRPMVAAQAIGIARAALEFARDYADRRAFGQPIIENQGISFPLADLAADIDAARLLTWRAAWMAAQRMPFEHAEGSMSKLKASEVAVRACEQANPDPRRMGLHQGLPGREVVPRRQAVHDLRGHQRDPAPGHRPRPACGREHRAA